MGRGTSAGGGQSSLGYLFGGGGEATNPQPTSKEEPNTEAATKPTPEPNTEPAAKPSPASQQVENSKTPAGVPCNITNNYHRADGQNCGNFITERPSTKVHAAPGGNSSLNYLFGDGSK